MRVESFSFRFVLKERSLRAYLVYGAFFSPSHFTTQEPSSGKPGADLSGAPSQPAAIIPTA